MGTRVAVAAAYLHSETPVVRHPARHHAVSRSAGGRCNHSEAHDHATESVARRTIAKLVKAALSSWRVLNPRTALLEARLRIAAVYSTSEAPLE